MGRLTAVMFAARSSAFAFLVTVSLALFAALASPARAAGPTGKVQGRIVATDTGDPIGFADVALVPADTAMKRVGGLTNADGTFLLEAAPGRYTVTIRALSYARARVEGLLVEAGKVLPFQTALTPEAIQQKEIVVEAKAKQNTESAMLAARKKAVTVGDAVSAEQVRKSPDKDAAEVLRRVTGLSVSDGKYVFVRGLGERYSSTEVDGVRIATPEQNKRVVPLDLLPANLLENIVVQKTYTADRPGEFGGGDVQVRTRDFPGGRTWSLSVSQGFAEGVTFKDRRTYASSRADLWGFGADSRKIPSAVFDVAGDNPLLLKTGNGTRGYLMSTLSNVLGAFENVWTPTMERTAPNGSYAVTYGDEFKVFGRPLGIIESASFARSFDNQDESQRWYQDKNSILYDYKVRQDKEAVQIGGISGLSYRLSPRHSLSLRGLVTHSADDEVRTYEGPDHNRDDSNGNPLVHRSTRLLYVERNVISGSLEGKHEFAFLRGLGLDWKFARSNARRQQPDRREVTYDRQTYFDGTKDVTQWVLGSNGIREFGDLKDNGWGTTANGTLPIKFGRLGNGKVVFGYDRQTKQRKNFYRRFNLLYDLFDPIITESPETIFSNPSKDSLVHVEEATLNIDNYAADQRVEAGYTSFDVPFGRRVRGYFGMRFEHGVQDVRTFDLFDKSQITARGRLDDEDWLPSANLTISATKALSVRLGASRTLSRPDLNELSPSPSLEYVGGYRVAGNPDLKRATIENYDLRVEGYPGVSEVLAVGFFYKRLQHPIEQVIHGGAPPIIAPENSEHGRNVGLELELRTGLGRIAKRLDRFSVNANASFISSYVQLKPSLGGAAGSRRHPLQGQANYLVNAALSCSMANGRVDASVLAGATGKRLRTLAIKLGDIYDQPTTTLDATLNMAPMKHLRLKFAAKNLLDPKIQQVQDGHEISGYRNGRAYSAALSLGS